MPDPVPFVREAPRICEALRANRCALGEMQRLVRGPIDLPLDGGPTCARHPRHTRCGRAMTADDGDGSSARRVGAERRRLHSQSIHQFGSATSVRSRLHYSDQAPCLAEMRLKPVWFDEQELAQHLSERYRPGRRQ